VFVPGKPFYSCARPIFITLDFLLDFMNRPNKLMFHYTKRKSPAREKHSSLLSPFVSYEENEVLCIVLPGANILAYWAQFVGYDENLKFKNYISTQTFSK
jgi:hypothetical protein